MKLGISKNRHDCKVPIKDISALPKLAPNASWIRRWIRKMREFLLIHPDHTKAKELFRSRAVILGERRKHATGPYFFVFHPMSIANMVVQIVFFMAWSFCLIVLPLEWLLLIEGTDIFESSLGRVVQTIKLLIIILFFNVGYVKKKTEEVVLQPTKIILRYLKTYFIFDIMSTPFLLFYPSRPFLNRAKDKGIILAITLGIKVSLTLGTAVRIPTLIKLLHDFLTYIKINKRLIFVMCQALKTLVILHLLTDVVVKAPLIVYRFTHSFSDKSWLIQSNYFHESKIMFHRYSESFILVACHFFGIEYKFDIIASNEQVIMVIISFFGRLYTLYLLADVLSIFGIADKSQSLYERQFALIERYMDHQRMPEDLRKRILLFYKHKYQGRSFREHTIMNSLSESLRTEMFLFAGKRMVEKVQVLKKLPSETLGFLLSRMHSEMYSARDVVFESGSEVDQLYFISMGTVAVLTSEGDELCHMRDGDMLGIVSLFIPQSKYTVVAAEISEVFIINRDEFMSILYEHPDAMHHFIRSAREILLKLDKLEQRASIKKLDLLSQLQSGKILECRTRKEIIAD